MAGFASDLYLVISIVEIIILLMIAVFMVMLSIKFWKEKRFGPVIAFSIFLIVCLTLTWWSLQDKFL
ncbi:hypothetical protein [Saccharibacillus kuerlensis]|uniref:Uncharacterized protein n=1 Tax=Saccharibacillus kuerlensis TaxID=459527 RepID=A0ABQ2L4C1_9BACL|nr:hypothetical protein [Saccharibacillus kuerlensis]GGO02587.1 hypothetical protein GCM10010969_26070 [Saccharibacillus kuerlensis]